MANFRGYYAHQCVYCGADSDQHDYEHLARECYPKQIRLLEAEITRLQEKLAGVREKTDG